MKAFKTDAKRTQQDQGVAPGKPPCEHPLACKNVTIAKCNAMSLAITSYLPLESILQELYWVLANRSLIVKTFRPLQKLPGLDRVVLDWEAEAEAHCYITTLLQIPAQG